ncbi:secretory phospholipase A2 receptor-like isoform X1 [Leguminivora glycinivorella]|uniref:secretory phospholipase A2 receptor-like isoform X1 n=1 Tax=Leguminivora glycinivorella TaxID=1035111 RepID=UPI00200EA2E0|nr:secretory phospholipase A2 receptor-like isoform X1 [Leguminivora glycinivorella]
MCTKYFITIVLLVCAAECVMDDYRFVSEIDGYLKLHRIPVQWKDARMKCHLEGGVLASPTDANILNAMKEILTKDEEQEGPEKIYTGIHATYANGYYTTVTGVPLSQIDVIWQKGQPYDQNTYYRSSNCLIMNRSGALAIVHCDNIYPYFCFKSTKNIDDHKCGPEYIYSDYQLYNRTGSCYKFHTEGKTWPNAYKTCMAEGAYLAIINSKTESEVLKAVFSEYSHDNIPGDFHKDAASIGFTKWDEYSTGYGDWFTIHGDSLAEAGFSTFNAGEPNNIDSPELCGSVWRTGLLNDHKCGRILAFICEKPYSQTTLPEY